MQIIQQNSQRSDSALASIAQAYRNDRPDIPGLPFFTDSELHAMHGYCLKFRALVRSGGTPTQEQDKNFMRYSAICYAEGTACE